MNFQLARFSCKNALVVAERCKNRESMFSIMYCRYSFSFQALVRVLMRICSSIVNHLALEGSSPTLCYIVEARN
jgi:hypothetical protein